MSNPKLNVRLRIGDSAMYRICVQGCLEDTWSDRLANMSITMDIKEGGAHISTLSGRLRDQAELVGVVNGLYELRLPLISLEMISIDKSDT
jgi:hypothetical protein